MWKDGVVRGPKLTGVPPDFCEVCVKAKARTKPFRPVRDLGVTKVLSLVLVDICGPVIVESLGFARYFVTIVDAYSRRYFVQPIKTKDHVLTVIKEFVIRREKETGESVKRLRTDNALEFASKALSDFCKTRGIVQEQWRAGSIILKGSKAIFFRQGISHFPPRGGASLMNTGGYPGIRCWGRGYRSILYFTQNFITEIQTENFTNIVSFSLSFE